MRRRVVFPEPEGPRKTRNSPSSVTRLTSLTAPSSPSLNTLVRFRVSTTAIAPPRDFGEHCGDHPRAESFGDAGRRVAGIADVGRPVENVAEHLVLVRGS